MDPSLFNTNAATGAMELREVDELQKALSAGYGTDMASLSGGAALRVQSLDTQMQATIQENKHFKLFNKLPKPKAGATVDEWTEQSDVGGFLGGTTNSELGAIAAATGTYNRRVGLVKFLMTRREVSFVQTLQTAIADSEATEYTNGAKQLLTDAEYLCFEGDSTIVPTEFDGIYGQMVAGVASGQVPSTNIIDLNAGPLSSIDPINAASAQISGFGNFGTPTDIFVSQLVQADFDSGLDPAFRVSLNNAPNSITLGTPVAGIRTSHGDVLMNNDVFIRDSDQLTPFEVRYPAFAAAQVGIKPVSLTGVAGSLASSNFAAAQAGNYYYAATGINANGQSTGTISAVIAVAAGQAVTLTITGSASTQETGYVISRSRLNGTNVITDMREMVKVPRAGATTTYVDDNRNIPGTTKAFILNMTPGDTAITWRQLLPMLRFNLYPTVSATIPWAQLMFGYLRITKRKHHVVLKNILPVKAAWRPFNV